VAEGTEGDVRGKEYFCAGVGWVLGRTGKGAVEAATPSSFSITAVRLKVEENQLVGVFGEIGVVVDGLKGA
jgi:hypothetical protein